VDQFECDASQMPSPRRHAACQKDRISTAGTAGLGLDSLAGRAATIETAHRKGSIMSTMRHLASPIAKSFSETLRIDIEAGSWIFVSGQVGVAIPPNNKPISFEQEVRVTFDRIRESLRKLDADMDKIVSIKVYLTDLAPYAEFSKVRGEVFPHNPPTSSAVQVAGLLLGARIEIDAVAIIAKG
jgi:2-iminobutanoate/2-iminopropanoate deaminase